MKSWGTLVAARWHARRPGVACPAGSDPWLVPPCIAPFSRSLGRCVSATSPFLSATGASGDHPMIKQSSQRARAVIFVDRVPRAGKRSKGFGSLPLPHPFSTPPTPPFMLMRGSLWGTGHLWLHRPLKENRAVAGISPSSRGGSMCGPDWALWARRTPPPRALALDGWCAGREVIGRGESEVWRELRDRIKESE